MTLEDALRVLIVADDVLARTGLATLIETQSDCEVVGQVGAGQSLARDVTVYQPDILLIDPGWSGIMALNQLATLSDRTMPIVVLLADEDDAPQALTLLADFGMFGLIPRDSDMDMLINALMTVSGGLIALDPIYLTALQGSLAPPDMAPVEPLTPREQDVIQLIAQGMTNRAIAAQLGITEHTVKFHVNAILSKFNAQSRTEAVVIATRAGLLAL